MLELGGRRPWLVVRVVALIALGCVYLAGATQHAQLVNTSKARADQTGYLWDAQQVYLNWHGRQPPLLVGERVRMPVYAAYLALFYSPRMTDAEFFEAAKLLNIRLSLGLLALLVVIFSWHLPPLVSTNLTLIVAFGYFIFRAGYSQPELLFYFLFFATFLACWHLFDEHTPARGLLLGILVGTLAALAHLTKAVMPPFVAIFLGVWATSEAGRFIQGLTQPGGGSSRDAISRVLWSAVTAAAVLVSFLAVIYPYIANSKRAFGEYFYNVNTSYYIWYDSGAEARATLLPHSDPEGRVLLPADQLPSARTYWRTHSVGQVLSRLTEGVEDMIIRSYTTHWYLKWVILYGVFALALITANRAAFIGLVRKRIALCSFLVLYAAVYLLSTAFFSSTSGTGTTRFLLAHVTPLLFVLSAFFTRPPFRDTCWTIAGARVMTTHFHLLVLVMMSFDLVFGLRSRLLTTYGGF